MNIPKVGNSSWPEILMSWMVNQGVSTVLLFALCYGIYVQVPVSIEFIQSGYDRNAASLAADVKRMEMVNERLLGWVEKNVRISEQMADVLEQQSQSIQANTNRLDSIQDSVDQ